MPNDQDPADLVVRMLRLKRYEQPPPGYFTHFAANVHARIDAEIQRPAPAWWHRIVPSHLVRPLLAGSFGLAVVGVYFVGLTLAGHWGQETAQATTGQQNVWALTPASVTPVAIDPIPLGTVGAQNASLVARDPIDTAASIAPVMDVNPPPGLFSPGAGLRPVQMDRASFSVRGK